jgi:hypothetical protein
MSALTGQLFYPASGFDPATLGGKVVVVVCPSSLPLASPLGRPPACPLPVGLSMVNTMYIMYDPHTNG